MNVSKLKKIHGFSMRHRDKICESTVCGCFHCLNIFPPSEIVEWTDQQNTALCPHCGVDGVLPESDQCEISEGLLSAMRNHWIAR